MSAFALPGSVLFRAAVLGLVRLGQFGVEAVLKPESFLIEKIYVPVKRRKALKPDVVDEIAESILEIGQQAPILMRADQNRFVLVEGLHRLEACKALGETTIMGVLVSAEIAHHKAHLPQSAEAEAERQKMERLRKLRLQRKLERKSRFHQALLRRRNHRSFCQNTGTTG